MIVQYSKRASSLTVVLAIVAASSHVLAQDGVPAPKQLDPIEERLAAAEDRIRRQDEAIARLLGTLEGQREDKRGPEKPPRAPEPSSWFQSLSDAVRLSGFIQADAVFHRQSSQDEVSSTGQPLNQDRFSIPRAHLRADIDQGVLLGAIEVEASTVSGPAMRVVDAGVSARLQGPDAAGPPLVMATLGLFKIPFGFEAPELDPHRLFLERSTLSHALFPGTYDLGVRLQGGISFLRYAIAFTNGEPIGEATFPGRDPNAAKDLVGRVGIDTFITSQVRICAGLSGLAGNGFHQGTPATKDTLVWRDDNQDGLVEITEVQVIPGAAATPSQNFARFAVGADLSVTARLPVLGDLVIYGEITRAENLDRGVVPVDPVGMGRDLRELGFYVGVTQELSRYAMIGLRYDRYDPDADANEQRGIRRVARDNTYSTLALTGALRYGRGRVIVEYDHNTNMLGRTAGGLPTSLADDAFALRSELRF